MEEQRQADANDDIIGEEDVGEEEEDDAIVAVFVKLNTILERRKRFPLRQRNKIVELAEEYVLKLGNDIHEMICDQDFDYDFAQKIDNFKGLNDNRDTFAEVETALRIFPEVVSRRKDVIWLDDDDEDNDTDDAGWFDVDDGEGELPIQCLLYYIYDNEDRHPRNIHALPFVALVAQIGIEFNQFQEEERGGLLVEDRYGFTTFHNLVKNNISSFGDENNRFDDNVILTLMIRLREVNLFKKEDIDEHRPRLVHHLCRDTEGSFSTFAENKFQFLVQWDPTSLVQTDIFGYLPLHYVAIRVYSTIVDFKSVFEYVIRYYPNKKGISLLFRKNSYGLTPFQLACRVQDQEYFPRDRVMMIVENTLNDADIPLNTVEAVLSAAIDEEQHIDCLYFLLRREPDILVRLLSRLTNNINNDGDDDDDDNDDGDDGNRRVDDEDINDGDAIATVPLMYTVTAGNTNHRKRKR